MLSSNGVPPGVQPLKYTSVACELVKSRTLSQQHYSKHSVGVCVFVNVAKHDHIQTHGQTLKSDGVRIVWFEVCFGF